MATRPKRPRDPNQLAALIVGVATGEIQDQDPNAGKDPAAIHRGKLGGLKGGKARAESLSAKKRVEIAKKASLARWKSKKSER